jgi:MoaA/NifB/PqqE/SkfB family radical SAM enzyme
VPKSAASPSEPAGFRDPPSLEPEAQALRRQIAEVLVRAPTLPIDLPAFQIRLLGVRTPKQAVELVLGKESAVAALRITARTNPDLLPLRRGSAVDVVVRSLHETAARHRAALDTMARRLQAAITPEQRDRAFELARQLRALPVGIPLEYFRQLVQGVSAQGLVRVGFGCNQDCGLCWQDRGWGRFPPEQVLRWIEDLRTQGARRLSISGGEPTLDRSLERYLSRARELGFEEISLETNAILLARPGLAERLRDAGLNFAFVSLHSGDPEVSDRITRAPGTHARTIQGVHRLMDAGIPTKFNAVMTGEGIDHLPALPGFLHQEFARHQAELRLMISYPTDPYDHDLFSEILPEPERLRRALRLTLDRCFELGIRVSGLDGPCGPPLCAHGADPRVASLELLKEPLSSRRYLPSCEGCSVRHACFGVRTRDADLFGERCTVPVRPQSLP